MHILANGAGRNLRSTITNHLNIRIMKIIKHYVTANRSDKNMEFLGYGKDEKGWFHITEEPETEEEKEELYSSFVIF